MNSPSKHSPWDSIEHLQDADEPISLLLIESGIEEVAHWSESPNHPGIGYGYHPPAGWVDQNNMPIDPADYDFWRPYVDAES